MFFLHSSWLMQCSLKRTHIITTIKPTKNLPFPPLISPLIMYRYYGRMIEMKIIFINEGTSMDNISKIILSIIALGLIEINVQLYNLCKSIQ